MPELLTLAVFSEGAGASLDFSSALTSALNGIQSDFSKYALIAIPVALAIWAGPKVLKIVMRFFNSLTH